MENRRLHSQTIIAAILFVNCFASLGIITPSHAETAILNWDKNEEADLAGYRIYQRIPPDVNFQLIFSGLPAQPNAPEYTVTGLLSGTTYNYVVTAFDQAGNEGAASNEVSKTTSGTPPPTPALTSPTPGSTFASDSQAFAWAANGASVTEWWLYVGNSLGSGDLHDSGSLGTQLSTTVTGLPTDGRTLFVRLFFKISGSWQEADYQFTASSPPTGTPALTSPTPGSTFASDSQAFAWAANGEPVTEWWLYVGNSLGSGDLHDSGSLGTQLSTTVTGLPTDGRTLFVRLFFKISGSWQEADYQFTAASPPTGTPALTSPTPGSTFASDSQAFAWAANGASVTEWWLYVGNNLGSGDLHDSGSLGTQLSTTVSGLPTDGRTLFVRLFFRISGSWQEADYQFTAASPGGTLLTDDFADGNFAGWTVVDQGTASGPSSWSATTGELRQTSNINNGSSSGLSLVGTHMRYDQGSSWTDYQLSLTLRSDDDDALGVMVRYQDPDNYYRFSWDRQRAYRRLVKVHNGVFTLLAEDSVPYVQGQTYQVDFLVEGAQLEVKIDGASVFNVADTSLTAGTVGLYTWANNGARFDNVQVTQGGNPPQPPTPALTSPTPGSTLASDSQTFAWAANGASVTEWWLYVGSSLGTADLHFSGSLGTQLSTTVTGLPTDGRTLFVRLFFRISGSWQEADYQFTASSPPTGTPALTSPTPGSTLASDSQTFAWAANGEPVTEWWLYVGSSLGTADLHFSGSLGTQLSTTVTGLPTDGSTLFVRLFFRISGSWQEADYQFTAASPSGTPALTSPTPGSTFASDSQAFAWAANGEPVTEWWLYVGNSLGSGDLHDSGSLGTQLSTTVTGLPTDGRTLFVRLFFKISGSWQEADYQFTAASTSGTPALTSPTPGSTLASDSQTFAWAANGEPVTEWWLYVGSSLGTADLHFSGSLGTQLSTTVTGLPTDGSTLFVRLFFRISGSWQEADYQFTAASTPTGTPALTSPTPGSTLASDSQTFAWAANGEPVTEWWLYVGNSLGAADLHDSGSLGTQLSTTVSGLPTDGRTLFVRLFFKISGSWQEADYQFTAADNPSLTTPIPGSSLTGNSATFAWAANGEPVTEWWLYVGNSLGAADLHDSGSLGTQLSTTVSGLPTDGRTLFVRLFFKISGSWQEADYQFTAGSS